MAETIGAKLRAARVARGLSVEDAAHETRIHGNNIRGLENDDYSGFANITYAKSFLSLYSRFLEVNAADVLAQFSFGDSSTSAGIGRTFLQPGTERIETGSRPSLFETRRSAEITSPGGTPVLLGLVLLLLLIAIPTLWYLGKDADSPEEVTTKLKELTSARLDENNPAAAGDRKEEPNSAETQVDSNSLAVVAAPPSSPANPEPQMGPAAPKKSAPLHARPIPPAATSVVSNSPPSENETAPTAPPERSTGESNAPVRQPVAPPKKPSSEKPEA